MQMKKKIHFSQPERFHGVFFQQLHNFIKKSKVRFSSLDESDLFAACDASFFRVAVKSDVAFFQQKTHKEPGNVEAFLVGGFNPSEKY